MEVLSFLKASDPISADCIGFANVTAEERLLFQVRILQREIRNLAVAVEFRTGCPKREFMRIGVKCLIAATIQMIPLMKTMEAVASKLMNGGKISRCFMRTWEILHMAGHWIESTTAEITARKIASGPLGENNTQTGVTTGFLLHSAKPRSSLCGQRNIDFLYPHSKIVLTEKACP
jgi:hypothetical protein